MEFKEAFNLLQQGKTLVIEDTEYRLGSKFPPSIQSRPAGNKELEWEDRIKGYMLFNLASDSWEVSDENN